MPEQWYSGVVAPEQFRSSSALACHAEALLLRRDRAGVALLWHDRAGALLLWHGNAGVAVLRHD